MTHELGHVTGFGSGTFEHMTVDECASPPNNTDETMCPTVPASHTAWYWSTLNTHDITVFQHAY